MTLCPLFDVSFKPYSSCSIYGNRYIIFIGPSVLCKIIQQRDPLFCFVLWEGQELYHFSPVLSLKLHEPHLFIKFLIHLFWLFGWSTSEKHRNKNKHTQWKSKPQPSHAVNFWVFWFRPKPIQGAKQIDGSGLLFCCESSPHIKQEVWIKIFNWRGKKKLSSLLQDEISKTWGTKTQGKITKNRCVKGCLAQYDQYGQESQVN